MTSTSSASPLSLPRAPRAPQLKTLSAKQGRGDIMIVVGGVVPAHPPGAQGRGRRG